MKEEKINQYSISIKTLCGHTVKIHQCGHTKWEAIDRLYNRISRKFPYNVERSKYTAIKI